MVIILYNLFFLLLVVPISLCIFILFPKRRQEIRERLGFVPEEIKKNIQNKKCIWLHAASVGESISLVPIIKLMENKIPDYEIIVSTMTTTGRNIIRNKVSEVRNIIYIPIDIRFCVDRVIKTINPSVFLMSETEIWPNLLFNLKKNKSRIILANGRISSKSFSFYKLIGKTFKHILSYIDVFNMTSSEDANRIIKLGADKNIVKIIGNSKFDIAIKKEQIEKITSDFDFIKDKKVLVAGSTHEGEELMILNVYRNILQEIKDVVLIIAPRHLERINNIEQVLNEKGISYIKRSEMNKNKTANVILLDTIGELSLIYSLSTVAFVGGSMVDIGGHNMMEPVFFRKPVLFGPYTQNFNELAKMLVENGCGIKVNNENELYKNIKLFLTSSLECEKKKELAKKVLEEYRNKIDSTVKNVDAIISFLIQNNTFI